VDWQIVSCNSETVVEEHTDTVAAAGPPPTSSADTNDLEWSSLISDHSEHLRAFGPNIFSDDPTISSSATSPA
jgi:hypothetical protein